MLCYLSNYKLRILHVPGEKDSDDDSFDFEVNRSMASTFMLHIDQREDDVIRNDENIDSNVDVSMTSEKQLTKSTIKSDDDVTVKEQTYNDKRIDTCSTYKDTSRISIDDSNSSTVEDEDEYLQSIESPTKYSETETELSEIIEVNDNKQIDTEKRLSLTNRSESVEEFNISRQFVALRESEIIETKSVSEDSAQYCHRISTTIAEIHKSPIRSSGQFDNGSPVLIPRVLQFGRTVFGSRAVRFPGQSFNDLKTSGENIYNVPTHVAEPSDKQDVEEPETDMQGLLTASELTRISIDKIFDTEVVNIIGTDHNQEDAVDKSHEIHSGDNLPESKIESDIDHDNHEPDQQDKAEKTDVQNASIDWNKDGIDDDENSFDFRKGVRKARQFLVDSSDEEWFENLVPIAHSSQKSITDFEPVEEMREARRSGGGNVSWRGEIDQTSPALVFETKTSADRLEDISSASKKINASIERETSAQDSIKKQRDCARIIDNFWSSSSPESSPEYLPKDNYKRKHKRSNKRSGLSDDAPPSKRQKNEAVQASSDGKFNWEKFKKELIVGTPLVYRLCRSKDHKSSIPPNIP
ncbi:uncharacterized protein LOC133531519 [Cydia pomonella]|uniref:uncharacterized protein LOC133531519 n=1 Tax=Cydia pomonella TaxID=82600 RepID=UPI002ADE2BFB|nr:uncharacterized protein LOC133531519 [Cydia pomonella]